MTDSDNQDQEVTGVDVRKAFRILPHQGTGIYKLDNCSHGNLVSFKASDPYVKANICPECLALCLSDSDEVFSGDDV